MCDLLIVTAAAAAGFTWALVAEASADRFDWPWLCLIGVASFWFNFVGVNLLFSGFHSYAGI